MWEKGSRIKILVGHYGSGKTEIALNMALEMKNHFDQVALVDLDIVNPFFRSAEQGDVLKQAGVKLLAPTFALTGLDIPALPAEIQMGGFNRPVLRKPQSPLWSLRNISNIWPRHPDQCERQNIQ